MRSQLERLIEVGITAMDEEIKGRQEQEYKRGQIDAYRDCYESLRHISQQTTYTRKFTEEVRGKLVGLGVNL